MAVSKVLSSFLRSCKTLKPCISYRAFQTTTWLSNTNDTTLTRSQTNWKARVELAGAYRMLERLNLHEGVCNHLTMMAPSYNGEGEVMLLIPWGQHWSQVTASSLLGISPSGQVVEGKGEAELSAICIHQGIRKVTPHPCIMHIHGPYLTALGCLEDPTVLNIHQTCIRFYNQIAYDNEYSYADELVMGESLGKKLADKQILMMSNHGALAATDTVAMAFDSLYYLERVCQLQVLAMSTGKKLKILPEELMIQTTSTSEYMKTLYKYANKHFFSWLAILRKECPELFSYPPEFKDMD